MNSKRLAEIDSDPEKITRGELALAYGVTFVVGALFWAVFVIGMIELIGWCK